MPGESPDLLTPSEVAARLRVSRTWLYDAAKNGRLPSIRVGGGEGPLRFVPEDLEEWINEARAKWTPGRRATASSRPVVARVAARHRRNA
jgi:excisionase family DNA binding protein